MVEIGFETAISVAMVHMPDDHRTVASFYWPRHQPTETYTVSKGNISLRLDQHVAVRPSEVVWRDTSTIGDETVLEELLGTEFAANMTEVRDQNAARALIQFELSPNSRLAIAKIQFEDASTPANLQRVLGGMIGELSLATSTEPPRMFA